MLARSGGFVDHIVAAVDRLRAEAAHVPTEQNIVWAALERFPLSVGSGRNDMRAGFQEGAKWAYAQRLPAGPELGTCEEEFRKVAQSWTMDTAHYGAMDGFKAAWRLFLPKPPEPDPRERAYCEFLKAGNFADGGQNRAAFNAGWDAKVDQ